VRNLTELNKKVKNICAIDTLLRETQDGAGRKELRELVKQIPKEMIQQAYNLLLSMLYCTKEHDELQIRIDIRRKKLEQMLKVLDQEVDLIDAEIIIDEEYHGIKRSRKEVEQYIDGYVDSLNDDIRALSLLISLKSLYDSSSLPLVPQIKIK